MVYVRSIVNIPFTSEAPLEVGGSSSSDSPVTKGASTPVSQRQRERGQYLLLDVAAGAFLEVESSASSVPAASVAELCSSSAVVAKVVEAVAKVAEAVAIVAQFVNDVKLAQ
jgi:hypothetical protein